MKLNYVSNYCIENVERSQSTITHQIATFCIYDILSGADVATAALVSIEVVEVSDDDRHRQRYREHPGDHTQCPDQLAPDSDRCDVAVANGRHGYDRPPERARYRRELRLFLSDLGVIGC